MDQITSTSDLNRAAVILAGGQGTRLTELTRQIAGFHLPKQFCTVVGNSTLLEQTRRRVSRCIRQEGIYFVLNRDHQSFFTSLLSGVPAQNLIVQPGNRGTAPAILYSLLRLVELAPSASVLLMPSDHYVADEAALANYVNHAFAAVEERPEITVLLGITPDQPETGYGWIMPGPVLHTSRCKMLEVRRFVEKPSAPIACELMAAGCLWNSFMIVGRATTLLGLFAIATPQLYKAFSKLRPAFGTYFEARAVERLYKNLPSVDFSREVLERAAVNLAVLPVQDVAWTDLGDPARVARVIGSLGIQQKSVAASQVHASAGAYSLIDSNPLSVSRVVDVRVN